MRLYYHLRYNVPHSKLLPIGDALSSGYESKLEELRDKLKRAKEGLRDSIGLGTWKRIVDESESTVLAVVIDAKARSSPQIKITKRAECSLQPRRWLLRGHEEAHAGKY